MLAAWHRILPLRNFSTVPAPTLKSRLRELYKRVHPDLFQAVPAAKEANERSFKLLQEYLAAAKHGGGIGRTAGLPYRFDFFVLPPGEQGEDDAAPSLQRVELTLPPPTKGPPGDALSLASRKAFGRLLTACGIPDDFSDAAGHNPGSGQLFSLRNFIPQAAEAFHQAAAAQGGPRHQLGAIRTALRLTRGVIVPIGGQAAGGGPLEQLPQVLQLSRVLEGLPGLDVSGLRVGVGQGYGVDALGTVWLLGGGHAEAWTKYLREVDLGHCRARRALADRVQAQEGAVARLLGVGLVHTHPQLSLDAAYAQFLERAADAGGQGGLQPGSALHGVSIHVDPEAGLEPQASGSHAGSSMDDAGVIHVPMSISSSGLRSTLQALGPQAAALARRRHDAEAELGQLRAQVERKLRLRRLARDPALEGGRFRAACLRLLQHSAEVGPLLDGLPIRVTEVNGLPADRSIVDIAWNWQL